MSEKNTKAKKSNTMILTIATICFVVFVVMFILIKSGTMSHIFDKQKPAPEVVYEDEIQKFVESKGYEIEKFWSVSTFYVPQSFDDKYTKYNELQKSQGYDLEPYKAVKCQEYVYLLKDYKIKGRNVYMTVIVKDGEVIGGHISTLSGDNTFYNFDGELYE